jgi:hypothetical protein
VALRPDEFYDHALAAADGERRLPLARMTEWEISPFEQGGLRVAPLRPPVMLEPARHGKDPSDCSSCRNRDKGIWFTERWRLTRIGGVGVPLADADAAIVADSLVTSFGGTSSAGLAKPRALRLCYVRGPEGIIVALAGKLH